MSEFGSEPPVWTRTNFAFHVECNDSQEITTLSDAITRKMYQDADGDAIEERCHFCGEGKVLSRFWKFFYLPEILPIAVQHLTEGSDPDGKSIQVLDTKSKIDYQERLDLSKLCERPADQENAIYRLIAVVVWQKDPKSGGGKKGSTGGHYYVYLEREDSPGNKVWQRLDEQSHYESQDLEDGLDDMRVDGKQQRILFYKKEHPQPDDTQKKTAGASNTGSQPASNDTPADATYEPYITTYHVQWKPSGNAGDQPDKTQTTTIMKLRGKGVDSDEEDDDEDPHANFENWVSVDTFRDAFRTLNLRILPVNRPVDDWRDILRQHRDPDGEVDYEIYTIAGLREMARGRDIQNIRGTARQPYVDALRAYDEANASESEPDSPANIPSEESQSQGDGSDSPLDEPEDADEDAANANDEEGGGNDEEGGGNDEEGGGNDEEGGGNDKEGGGNDKEGGGNDKEGGGNDKEGGGNDKEGGGNDKEGGGNDKEGGGNDKEGGGNDKEGGGNDKEGGGNDEEGGGNDKEADANNKGAGANDEEADANNKGAGANDKVANANDEEADADAPDPALEAKLQQLEKLIASLEKLDKPCTCALNGQVLGDPTRQGQGDDPAKKCNRGLHIQITPTGGSQDLGSRDYWFPVEPQYDNENLRLQVSAQVLRPTEEGLHPVRFSFAGPQPAEGDEQVLPEDAPFKNTIKFMLPFYVHPKNITYEMWLEDIPDVPLMDTRGTDVVFQPQAAGPSQQGTPPSQPLPSVTSIASTGEQPEVPPGPSPSKDKARTASEASLEEGGSPSQKPKIGP
ncbi:hypothetical protein VMCG_05862 [Cytospora schulzeri]|uniref:USP domain-containing protein n=1 Tax=Cytospora schulzeri TaxID=448051 RepID=A0A423WDC3_9PEZI|nr:hypothetical protein VMCG_05862 [Valsa malicola]